MTNNEYQVGDLIEAVKGESMVRGRLKPGTYASTSHYLYVGDNSALREVYIRDGWTITVIETAKPNVELPTEPGWYVDRHDCMWRKHTDGELTRLVNADWLPESCAPFTRLEPVAVTAKAVLDEVGKFAWADGFTAQIEATAKKFGVTS